MSSAAPLTLTSKRRRLRDSPFLQPLAQRPLEPAKKNVAPPTRSPNHPPRFPHTTRQRWLLEALELMEATTVSLELQSRLSDSVQHKRELDTTMIDFPSLETPTVLALTTIMAYQEPPKWGKEANMSVKEPPVCNPRYAPLPLYVRGDCKRSPTKPPHRLPVSTAKRLSISTLVSKEMVIKLQTHLEAKIKGNHWQNEIRSRLARPLSASVFSTRDEQLEHELAAKQYRSERPLAIGSAPLYPYSLEAHAWSRRIGRMYRIRCYRRELLFNVRRLAITIRYFHRVVLPWLVKAHRRRRRAAIKIQRRLRRFLHWKRFTLRPFAQRFVQNVVRHACLRVNARFVVAAKLRRLVYARRERELFERQRRHVLFRWVAKTRVAMFVHKVWCVKWFSGKRERNLVRLRDEVTQLEASDAAVHVEYSTIFITAFGRKLLKKELTAWRQTLSKPKPPAIAVAGDASDPAIVRLRQCFTVFDMDGSGSLDLDEFELMLAYLRSSLARNSNANANGTNAKRVELTTAQAHDLFESLDGDGNGKVSCDEFELWWLTTQQRSSTGDAVASGSASVSLLSTGLDQVVLTGHGMLFWLLGKKQQLERKFVKKLMVKKAQDCAKRALVESWRQQETRPDDETRRCGQCARRFGLQRDRADHVKHQCESSEGQWVLDAFLWKRWGREEELRLLEEEAGDEEGEEEESVGRSESVGARTYR